MERVPLSTGDAATRGGLGDRREFPVHTHTGPPDGDGDGKEVRGLEHPRQENIEEDKDENPGSPEEELLAIELVSRSFGPCLC